jgi:hypothetical protein
MELRFNCPMKECPQYVDADTGLIGYQYAKAIEHQKNCEFRRHFCVLNCGAKIYRSEVEEHSKVCPEKVEVCEKCNIPVKVNQVAKDKPHDCIEEMKKFLKKTIDEKKKIEFEYGINYEVMNNTCTAGH